MNVVGTVLKLFIILFCCIPIFFSFLIARRSWRSRRYIPSEGTIVSARIDWVFNDSEVRPVAEIRAKYEVEGRSYERDLNSGPFLSEEDCALFLKSLPVGKRIAIFYDPEEPETYVLRKPSGWEEFPGVAILLVFSVPVLILVIQGP
jgi:hypothetical protein